MQQNSKWSMYSVTIRVVTILMIVGFSVLGVYINHRASQAKIESLVEANAANGIEIQMGVNGDPSETAVVRVPKGVLEKSNSPDGNGQYKDIPDDWDEPTDAETDGVLGAATPVTASPIISSAQSSIGKKVPSYGDNHFGIFEPNILAGGRIDGIQRDLDYEIDMFGNYINWNQKLASNTVLEVCRRKAIPVITWQSWNGRAGWSGGQDYPLKRIAAGAYDNIIISNFTELLTKCKSNVIIRFNHEMSLVPGKYGWYPWQGDPEAYIAAWRRVVTVVNKIGGSDRVFWHWNPDQASSYADLYYPGDNFVDYVGVTINHHKSGGVWTKFEWMYGASQQMLEKHNKPVLIAETASVEDKNPAKKATWASEAFTYMQSNRTMVGMIWFSIDASNDDETLDYRYNSHPDTVTALRRVLP